MPGLRIKPGRKRGCVATLRQPAPAACGSHKLRAASRTCVRRPPPRFSIPRMRPDYRASGSRASHRTLGFARLSARATSPTLRRVMWPRALCSHLPRRQRAWICMRSGGRASRLIPKSRARLLDRARREASYLWDSDTHSASTHRADRANRAAIAYGMSTTLPTVHPQKHIALVHDL